VRVIDLKIYCANMAVNSVNGNSLMAIAVLLPATRLRLRLGTHETTKTCLLFGAGIGGLKAAVGLRRSGHNVAVGLNPSPSKPVLLA
jgi:heterodisulfide reductase subunit A-like polyferredoxin